MRCYFCAAITGDEKRLIRRSLRAFELATQVLGLELGQTWDVIRVRDDRWGGLIARHRASGAELWAPTAWQLGREIGKAAAFLAGPRREKVLS